MHIAISTGWTIDYVGWNLDLPRLLSLNKYWRRYPPIHILIANYLGYKEPVVTDNVAKTGEMNDENLADFMANVPTFKFQPPVMKNGD